jgi:nicotinate-nucleotide pyrophosphorylase (carboxylating)
VAAALQKALRNRHEEQPIEIEVRNLSELEEALANGAESILLDNMAVEDVRAAVVRVGSHSRPVPMEASGGIRLENVRAYAETGVDYISVGALTHSAQAVDLSMKIVPA